MKLTNIYKIMVGSQVCNSNIISVNENMFFVGVFARLSVCKISPENMDRC